MSSYEFIVVLKDAPELTDKLFAAGCNEGTPGMCAGVTLIDFHRKATSLEEAIRSAIADVSSTGCVVDHIEISANTFAAPA